MHILYRINRNETDLELIFQKRKEYIKKRLIKHQLSKGGTAGLALILLISFIKDDISHFEDEGM